MTYEGSANYETAMIAQWIANDEELYEHWKLAAMEAEDVLSLSERLQDEFEWEMPDLHGIWWDLLVSAFEEIDWFEIAEDLIRND